MFNNHDIDFCDGVLETLELCTLCYVLLFSTGWHCRNAKNLVSLEINKYGRE